MKRIGAGLRAKRHAHDHVHWSQEHRQVADPEGPALSRHRKRTGWRLLRGVAVRKKRGAEKPDLECALGGCASKASATLAQDLAAGESSFRKCQPCHDVGETAKNKLGPELNG